MAGLPLMELPDELLGLIVLALDDTSAWKFRGYNRRCKFLSHKHPFMQFIFQQLKKRVPAFNIMEAKLDRAGKDVITIQTKTMHRTASMDELRDDERLRWLWKKDDGGKYVYNVGNPLLRRLREHGQARIDYEQLVRGASALCHHAAAPHKCCVPVGFEKLRDNGSIQEHTNGNNKKEYILTSTKHCLRCLDRSEMTYEYRKRVRPTGQPTDDDLLLIRPDGWVEGPGWTPSPSSCLVQRRFLKVYRSEGQVRQVDHIYGLVVVSRVKSGAGP